MHCLKILPLSPPSLRCPVIVVRHIGLWFLATPRGPHSGPSASQSAAAFVPCIVSPTLPSQHPARRYRGSCVMAGVRNVQRSFVGVV